MSKFKFLSTIAVLVLMLLSTEVVYADRHGEPDIIVTAPRLPPHLV